MTAARPVGVWKCYCQSVEMVGISLTSLDIRPGAKSFLRRAWRADWWGCVKGVGVCQVGGGGRLCKFTFLSGRLSWVWLENCVRPHSCKPQAVYSVVVYGVLLT